MSGKTVRRAIEKVSFCDCCGEAGKQMIDQALIEIGAAMPSEIEIQKAICNRCKIDGYDGDCGGDDVTCKLMAKAIRQLIEERVK